MSTAGPRNEGAQGSAEETTGVMRGVRRTKRLQGLLGSVLEELQLELLQRQAPEDTKEGPDGLHIVMYVKASMM